MNFDLSKLATVIGPIGTIVFVWLLLEYKEPVTQPVTNTEFQELVMRRLAKVEADYQECLNNQVLTMKETSLLRTSLIVMQSSSDSSPFASWMKDLQGNMVFVNTKYETKFLTCRGYSKEDYIGKDDYSVWPSEVAESFRENDRMVIETGRLFDFTEEVETCDGGRERLRFVKWPRYAAGNVMVGVDGMFIPQVVGT